MLKLVIDPEKLYRATSYTSTAYVVAIWPSFLFDSFVNIWASCEIFLGKWFTTPRLPPPISRTPMLRQISLQSPPFFPSSPPPTPFYACYRG